MRLWRLSSERRARAFDGGYGLSYDGRWNSKGRPVTYCSTGPSLATAEKRVHVADPGLLPPQVMVEYDVPDDIPLRALAIADLPNDWPRREVDTQKLGDAWLDAATEAVLLVPSVIVPIADAPDRNALVNHRHPAVARITIARIVPFSLDPRLFRP